MSLLIAADLAKSFGGVHAVAGVSFAVAAGERLAIIGPNGAGKTTCFNMVGGQLDPDRGEVRLAGEPITGLPPHAIAAKGVGRTFQIAQAFGSMSVVENVQMAFMARHRRLRSLLAPARRLYRAEAMALLDLVGMTGQAERPCSVLAYGDIKRVELAIALVGAPRLLLMDEPTAGMAPGERQALMELVSRIVAERGIAVLFTEHDMDVVFTHADRILVLARGRIIADGTPAEVRADPQVQAIYLGGGHA
jgi:ABC-type branched-subunit amino acid transport system ATPase component